MGNKNKKMRIALVNANTAPIPDVIGGGAERLVTMLIDQNELDKRVELIVFSPFHPEAVKLSSNYKETIFFYIGKNSWIEKLYNCFVKLLKKILKRDFNKRGYYSKVAKILQKENIDMVIDENGYVYDINLISRVVGKKKLAAHIHWLVNPVERNVDGLYGSVIGVSKYVSNYWKNTSEDKTLLARTVYSAVDQSRFKNKISENEKEVLCEELGINKNAVIISFCGRIDEQKGPLVLFKAFEIIEKKYPETVLLFIGGSDKKGTLISNYHQKLLDASKGKRNIIFTGYIPNVELYKYYQISDILVIPTLVEEAAGLVAIEGMLSGLPIVATRSGGLPEYVSDKCAILVSKEERIVEQLEEAIGKLIKNVELRRTMSGNAIAQGERFSQQRYYDNFIDTVRNLIDDEEE